MQGAKPKRQKMALRSARTELSTLRREVDSLEKKREILEPTIADWEKRLNEKAEAVAVLTALESKRRQTEAVSHRPPNDWRIPARIW